MTRKQEGTRQIQKPRQGQGQKGQEQNINISLSVCFSCSSLFYRTSRETNREVKSGEGGGVLECRYMTIQFITRHKKKKEKPHRGHLLSLSSTGIISSHKIKDEFQKESENVYLLC